MPSDSTEIAKLFKTIRSGQSQELSKMLDQGADANAVMDGYSALMAATLSGSLDQMKILVAHGAKVNYYGRDSMTALWMAIPYWEKTIFLLDNGADMNQVSKEGLAPFVKIAGYPGTAKLMNEFISRGFDIKKCGGAEFLMFYAVGTNDTAVLGIVLRAGISPKNFMAPLVGAANYRSYETVKMMVENGADVNEQIAGSDLKLLNGITPLMLVVLNQDKESLNYLLDHGADPNKRHWRGYTVLMMLQQSHEDQPEMTKALLDHGADPNAKAIDGTDALYFAMKKGNTESVKIIQKYIQQQKSTK